MTKIFVAALIAVLAIASVPSVSEAACRARGQRAKAVVKFLLPPYGK